MMQKADQKYILKISWQGEIINNSGIVKDATTSAKTISKSLLKLYNLHFKKSWSC